MATCSFPELWELPVRTDTNTPGLQRRALKYLLACWVLALCLQPGAGSPSYPPWHGGTFPLPTGLAGLSVPRSCSVGWEGSIPNCRISTGALSHLSSGSLQGKEGQGERYQGGLRQLARDPPGPWCSPRTLNLHSGQVCCSISHGSTQSRWNSCLHGSTRSHYGVGGGHRL